MWGITKKYKGLSWWENFMGGHISIGKFTIYGCNAMNWVVNIRTKKWGVICFTLPVLARWRKGRDGQYHYYWYFYLSPNGTPWAATYYRGSDKKEKIRAEIRKMHFGHNFKCWDDEMGRKLHELNNKIPL